MKRLRLMFLGFSWVLPALLGSGPSVIADSDSSFVNSPAVNYSSLQKFLGLPKSVGTITDASMDPARGIPQFFLIQDVHKHPEAQRHIAQILMRGYHRWGLRKIFIEGAFLPVDFYIFQTIPEESRRPLLTRLMNEGNLSGAEMAAILINEADSRGDYVSPFQVIGMEDPQFYKDNLSAFETTQTECPKALQALSDIQWLQSKMGIPQDNPMAQQLRRTELLIQLKLTPAEYHEYVQHKDSTPSSSVVDPVISMAEKFYKIANLRSWIFLEHATRMIPAWTGPRVLVVGGFHTALMAEALRKSGKSFVVLRPSITTPGNENVYEKGLQDTADDLHINQTADRKTYLKVDSNLLSAR